MLPVLEYQLLGGSNSEARDESGRLPSDLNVLARRAGLSAGADRSAWLGYVSHEADQVEEPTAGGWGDRSTTESGAGGLIEAGVSGR